MTQNQWGNLNKDFIKAVRGGGHRFMKVFHKIPVFFEGWLPLPSHGSPLKKYSYLWGNHP